MGRLKKSDLVTESPDVLYGRLLAYRQRTWSELEDFSVEKTIYRLFVSADVE
jgi:hypothetical protein